MWKNRRKSWIRNRQLHSPTCLWVFVCVLCTTKEEIKWEVSTGQLDLTKSGRRNGRTGGDFWRYKKNKNNNNKWAREENDATCLVDWPVIVWRKFRATQLNITHRRLHERIQLSVDRLLLSRAACETHDRVVNEWSPSSVHNSIVNKWR